MYCPALNHAQKFANLTATYPVTLDAGEDATVVVCANGATYATSSNAIKCVVSRALNTIVVTKKVADAETGLIDEAFVYSAGTNFIIVKDPDNKVNVFYNTARVGTEQTVSDATVIYNKRHYVEGDGSGAFSVERLRYVNGYTSNFSSGVDGFTASAATVAEGTGGFSDTLELTVNGAASYHSAVKTAQFTIGELYRVRYDYFIPSANSILDGIRASDGPQWFHATGGTLDAWTPVDVYIIAQATGLIMYAYAGGSGSFQDVGANDVLYVRDVIIDAVNP